MDVWSKCGKKRSIEEQSKDKTYSVQHDLLRKYPNQKHVCLI